nr:galactosylgalactosylxylosylprotein 3-beta-glucuronosyltransferase S-like [Cherax quadricarinatus]
MVHLLPSRSTLLILVVVEAVCLLVVMLGQQVTVLNLCSQDTHQHTDSATLPWPTVYVITPTYRRASQLADMTRVSQTLMHIRNLHWIVVEDAEMRSQVVSELLERSGLPFTHLCATTPPQHKNQKSMGKGVFNRREGLRWLRENAMDGVLYFADDDNSYDIRLFEQIRTTKKASVFPVGMILKLGVSSPIVRNSKVVAFHDSFQAGRKFAVDMAGFAVNLRVIHANPNATIPLRLSYLEDGFLRQLRLELDDLEPLASGCTQVLVWHTKTQKASSPNMKHVTHTDFDTNLVELYHNLLH